MAEVAKSYFSLYPFENVNKNIGSVNDFELKSSISYLTLWLTSIGLSLFAIQPSLSIWSRNSRKLEPTVHDWMETLKCIV